MSGMVEDQCRYVFVLTLSQPVMTFVVCFSHLLIMFIYPQTVFVVGILFSHCPSIVNVLFP